MSDGTVSVLADQFRLDGKRALVTGASRGIGRGIALGLAAAGADLALVSRSRQLLESCAAEVRALSRQAIVVPADLSKMSDVRALPERVETELGPIDILVNVAGFNRRTPAIEMSEEAWDDVVTVNLRSVFFLCQGVARRWIETERFAAPFGRPKGKIISIGSLAGAIGFPGQAQYSASKAGLVGMSRVLSTEWAPHGICVNVIAPGYIETDLTVPIWRDPIRSARVLGRTPAGRPGQVAELTGTALYLASAASDYVTGQTIFVDGGFQAG
ncbi:MAG: SDR family NAD(P)-dependent oxidoreductase [Chloroflexota bacterium]